MNQPSTPQSVTHQGSTHVAPELLFRQRLDDFVDHQMQGVSLSELVGSTAGMVVVCAFMMGAGRALARQQALAWADVHGMIEQCLVERFGMTAFNAEGLVSASERLAQKYYLIDSIQQEGEVALSGWQENGESQSVLVSIIEEGRLQTLSDLDADGVRRAKELSDVTAPELRSADSWIAKLLFWLVVLLVVAAAGWWFFGHTDFLSHLEQLGLGEIP